MRSLTLPIAVIVASLGATFACTHASTIGENLSTDSDRQTKKDGGNDLDAGPATDDAAPPPATDAGPAQRTCVDMGGGGSSGSDLSCGFEERYSCSDGNVSIDCTCGPNRTNGKCTCLDGTTFAHDCTQGCVPSDAERAACNVPKPQPSPPGSSSGSTSSSSGGGSSGSTSSSSGASGSTSSSGGSSSGG